MDILLSRHLFGREEKMIRHAAVAGMFYERDPELLKRSIEDSLRGEFGPGRLPSKTTASSRSIIGLVSPHAGYQFSGSAASYSYLELAEDGLPDTAIIIGPNHRGIGVRAAVALTGSWRTPLGDVEIDSELARDILSHTDLAKEDDMAHFAEHSIEVQVPFLQYINPRIRIVPIALSIFPSEGGQMFAESIGSAIAKSVEGRNAVIIASTDFTHEQPKSVAEKQDREAISAIEKLDYVGLLDVVERKRITMCGVVPTATVIAACKELGANSAELLTYYTSGDIIGDESRVVGYAAMKIVR
jgi:MEMO1 family protein